MLIKEITSPQNSTFLKFLKLQRGHEIKKSGFSFLCGPKQVQEVLKDYADQCSAVLLGREHALPEIPESSAIQCYRLSPALFQKIDIYGTGSALLIIKIKPLPLWSFDHEEAEGCTLFIPFQDPMNVGAVVRSAAAFGVSRLVMLQEAAHPFHHKALRVSGSAVFRLPIFRGPSIRELSKPNFSIFTLSPVGEDLRNFRFPASFGLLPGLEGPGIPSELHAFKSLGIPMLNRVESLNAGTATAIVLYEWRSQCRQRGK